jgi:hypothetical protein
MLRSLVHSTSPLALSIGFDADPAAGGTPAPSPAPAPAPSILTGGEGDAGTGGDGAGSGDSGDADAGTGGDADGEGGDASGDGDTPAQTDAEKAAAEEERRAALTDEERAADKAKLAEAGAPETYDFAEVLGEDGPQLNDELLGEFTGILKDHNLTQEQANQYMGFAQKLQESWLGQITQAHVDARAGWRNEAQTDAEIGGDKFPETVATAKKALDAFGTPKLKALLDETGIGDHPEVIRFFHNVGVVNAEHDFVKAGKPEAKKPFYDHPTSQKA